MGGGTSDGTASTAQFREVELRTLLELEMLDPPGELTLAEGFENAADYLRENQILGQSDLVSDAVYRMGYEDARTILENERPGYKGRFRVVFGDFRSGLVKLHGISKMYVQD